MKKLKSISKKGLVIISMVAILGSIASAGMILYYMNTTSSHGVGHVFEITDNADGSFNVPVKMETYDIVYDTNDMIGGDSEQFQFNITLNGNSNANRNLYFDITEDIENGVNLTIWNIDDDIAVTDESFVTFTKGETIHFEYRVALDAYTPEGNYQTALKLEKA